MPDTGLVYLADHQPTPGVPRENVARIDQFMDKVHTFRNAEIFVDQRTVCRKLFSRLVDCHADLIAHLKKDVMLIIESKVRPGSEDRDREIVFRSVLELDEKTDLSFQEILEIRNEKHPEEFIIGGHVNQAAKAITLYRGDFSPIIVSFDRFKKNAQSEPDFSKFQTTDHGMTLRFGDYEASIYPILYEFDAEYRRRYNRQRKAKEKTFGACLYRARRILKLNQDDFPGLRRETILRIENRKSKSVRPSTKTKILKRMALTEKELLAY